MFLKRQTREQEKLCTKSKMVFVVVVIDSAIILPVQLHILCILKINQLRNILCLFIYFLSKGHISAF